MPPDRPVDGRGGGAYGSHGVPAQAGTLRMLMAWARGFGRGAGTPRHQRRRRPSAATRGMPLIPVVRGAGAARRARPPRLL